MLRWKVEKLMSRSALMDIGDVSLVLGMGVTRDPRKRTVTITPVKYAQFL